MAPIKQSLLDLLIVLLAFSCHFFFFLSAFSYDFHVTTVKTETSATTRLRPSGSSSLESGLKLLPWNSRSVYLSMHLCLTIRTGLCDFSGNKTHTWLVISFTDIQQREILVFLVFSLLEFRCQVYQT